jgi:hypothetical protein
VLLSMNAQPENRERFGITRSSHSPLANFARQNSQPSRPLVSG